MLHCLGLEDRIGLALGIAGATTVLYNELEVIFPSFTV